MYVKIIRPPILRREHPRSKENEIKRRVKDDPAPNLGIIGIIALTEHSTKKEIASDERTRPNRVRRPTRRRPIVLGMPGSRKSRLLDARTRETCYDPAGIAEDLTKTRNAPRLVRRPQCTW